MNKIVRSIAAIGFASLMVGSNIQSAHKTGSQSSQISKPTVTQTNKSVIVTVTIPAGVDQNAISIVAKGKKLMIGTDSAKPKSGSKAKPFNQTIMLPARVNATKATVTMKNGILTVTLPKGISYIKRVVIQGPKKQA